MININSERYEERLGINSRPKKSGLKLVRVAEPPCISYEHDPPMHIVLQPGTYEYTCPACGRIQVFTVPCIIS